jgi:hypothetical protein
MATINLRDMGESRDLLSITPLRGLTTREPGSPSVARRRRAGRLRPHGAPEPELPGDARLVCTASNRSLAEQF